MKQKLRKAAAAALAMTMCVPGAALAAESSGSFDTSFDVYSPALTVSVPVNADIRVNPLATNSATSVKKFTIASNSIDILNASVDVESDTTIPVVATIQASISSKNEDVITKYNSFTEDNKSTKKKVYLQLSEAQTAATVDVKTGGTAAFDTDNKLDLSQYAVDTEAVYTAPAKAVPITGYGSLLSMAIAAPTTTDTTAGATFSTDATKVEAGVGSFAVTGNANTNADWKADDVKVDITYNIKASQDLSIVNPAVTAVTATGSAAAATITVPDVGESTIAAVAIHNDEAAYGDYMLEGYEVEYKDDTGKTDAEITIPAEHAALVFLADEANGCAGKEQDLVIGLSDGRMVVTTLKVNAAP